MPYVMMSKIKLMIAYGIEGKFQGGIVFWEILLFIGRFFS
jgi:hypothetical protein